jgi:hypothetical protein
MYSPEIWVEGSKIKYPMLKLGLKLGLKSEITRLIRTKIDAIMLNILKALANQSSTLSKVLFFISNEFKI